jgi:hypothetical protein
MTSGGAFPDTLTQHLGVTYQLSPARGGGASDPISSLMGGANSSALSSSLASPQIAKALASAQKNVSSALTSAGTAAGTALTGAANTVTSATTAVTGAASTKAKNAVAWAKGMVGRQDWNNLCERFVEEAYGTRGIYRTAKDAGKQLVTHRGSSSLRTAPAGALLYFAADDTNDQAGHAAVYLGNGEMISARPDGVKVERVDTPYNAARYLGWGAPPTKFPGRKTAAATTSATRAPAPGPANTTRTTPLAPSAATPALGALTPRSAPASGSSLATPGLAAVPPALRQPPRPASSPR